MFRVDTYYRNLRVSLTAMAGMLAVDEQNTEATEQEMCSVINDVWDKWDIASPDQTRNFSDDVVCIRVVGDPVQSSITICGSENEKNIVDHAVETALTWKNQPAYKAQRLSES